MLLQENLDYYIGKGAMIVTKVLAWASVAGLLAAASDCGSGGPANCLWRAWGCGCEGGARALQSASGDPGRLYAARAMPALILPPRYTPDSIAIWSAALQAGWDVERLAGWHTPEHLRDADPVLYGEPLFAAAAVADSLGLSLLEPDPGWLPALPLAYRGRSVSLSTLGAARALATAAFIKSASDKSFPARVYAAGTDLPREEILPHDQPVLIAEPVRWTVEFRFFVLDGTIATGSVYIRGGGLAEAEDGSWPAESEDTEAAHNFAPRVVADQAAAVPAAVVLDVGQIAGYGWAVVEANSAWGSGLCGCDPTKVLAALRRACSPQGP